MGLGKPICSVPWHGVSGSLSGPDDMSSSCQHTLEDLTRCLRESDCMQARMHSLRST